MVSAHLVGASAALAHLDIGFIEARSVVSASRDHRPRLILNAGVRWQIAPAVLPEIRFAAAALLHPDTGFYAVYAVLPGALEIGARWTPDVAEEREIPATRFARDEGGAPFAVDICAAAIFAGVARAAVAAPASAAVAAPTKIRHTLESRHSAVARFLRASPAPHGFIAAIVPPGVALAPARSALPMLAFYPAVAPEPGACVDPRAFIAPDAGQTTIIVVEIGGGSAAVVLAGAVFSVHLLPARVSDLPSQIPDERGRTSISAVFLSDAPAYEFYGPYTLALST